MWGSFGLEVWALSDSNQVAFGCTGSTGLSIGLGSRGLGIEVCSWSCLRMSADV